MRFWFTVTRKLGAIALRPALPFLMKGVHSYVRRERSPEWCMQQLVQGIYMGRHWHVGAACIQWHVSNDELARMWLGYVSRFIDYAGNKLNNRDVALIMKFRAEIIRQSGDGLGHVVAPPAAN